MSKYVFLICILLFLSCDGFDANTLEVLKKKTLRVETEKELFKKIYPDIIENDIIFLGEQDHGDATTFLLKAQLIESLVKKSKDSILLVFESDYIGFKYFSNTSNYKEFIYPIWSECVQNNFFDIIDSLVKKRKISITGMDPYIFPSTRRKCKSINSELLTTIKNIIISDSLKTCNKTTQKNIEKLSNIVSDDNESILAYLNGKCKKHSGEIRDIQMAKNLYEIYMKNKNKKIVVWAANSHITKYYLKYFYSENAKKLFSTSRSISMCEFFNKNYNVKTLSLAFSSKYGQFGRIGASNSTQINVSKNDFEYYTNSPISIVELNTNDSLVFNSQIFSHYSYKAEWSKMFDYIVVVDSIKSCLND